MSKTLTGVTRDAANLPGSERLKLARILLVLSDPTTESPDDVQDAWDEEIERRPQELRSGKVKSVPLEEITAKIEARLPS
jgi:putative addiction module component (TIGR02574 family)